MKVLINHRPYILIGCILWVISFFGEIFGLQPYSTIGILLSPILTVYGIFHWFKFYKSTRGHYPRFYKTWRETNKQMSKNPFAGIGFMLGHLLEFWTFTIVFWMGMILIMFLTTRPSNAFRAAKAYCNRDSAIIEKTGNIWYYCILVSGNISTNRQSGTSDLRFIVVGEKGNFKVNAELTNENDVWRVVNLEME